MTSRFTPQWFYRAATDYKFVGKNDLVKTGFSLCRGRVLAFASSVFRPTKTTGNVPPGPFLECSKYGS